MAGVVIGGLLAILGGLLGTVYASILEDRRDARRAASAAAAAVDLGVEEILHASSDVAIHGSWVSAAWSATGKRHVDDLLPLREALRETSRALDRLRIVAPIEVQRPAATLYDAAIAYFAAVTDHRFGDQLSSVASDLQAARAALLEATDRTVLPLGEGN